jgi:transcription antitermination factor NusG
MQAKSGNAERGAVSPRAARFLRMRKIAREEMQKRGPWFDQRGCCPDGDWFVVEGNPRRALWRLVETRRDGAAPPVDMLCPVERREGRTGLGRRRHRRIIETPLFGSYFFLRASGLVGDGALRESVLALDGVAGFVGVDPDGWPRPVRDARFQQLFLDPVVERKTAPILIGERVRVAAGPFMGMEAPVHRLLGGLDAGARIVLLVSIMGGPVPVTLQTGQIERLARAG